MKAKQKPITPSQRKTARAEEEQYQEQMELHTPEPIEDGFQGVLFEEEEEPATDLDQIREDLEKEKERIKAERAAQGKTGRPGKSDRQRQLEAELEAKTTRFAGGAARATPPGEDAEQMFLGFDTLTPDTIINLYDMAQTALLKAAGHPEPERLPLTNAEKKALKPPLTAYLNEQSVQLTPGAALLLTVFSISAARALPVILQKYEEMKARNERKIRMKTN